MANRVASNGSGPPDHSVANSHAATNTKSFPALQTKIFGARSASLFSVVSLWLSRQGRQHRARARPIESRAKFSPLSFSSGISEFECKPGMKAESLWVVLPGHHQRRR
jgi:hypothetical protein